MTRFFLPAVKNEEVNASPENAQPPAKTAREKAATKVHGRSRIDVLEWIESLTINPKPHEKYLNAINIHPLLTALVGEQEWYSIRRARGTGSGICVRLTPYQPSESMEHGVTPHPWTKSTLATLFRPFVENWPGRQDTLMISPLWEASAFSNPVSYLEIRFELSDDDDAHHPVLSKEWPLQFSIYRSKGITLPDFVGFVIKKLEESTTFGHYVFEVAVCLDQEQVAKVVLKLKYWAGVELHTTKRKKMSCLDAHALRCSFIITENEIPRDTELEHVAFENHFWPRIY